MELYNNDCFEILPEIKDGSVDLVVVDLPYTTKGQKATACKWDTPIDLERMWKELKRCCKRDCVYVFFCTTKFGYKLIQSNERWFRYDIVWEKSRKVGFLSANKMPLRKHEMMYIFSDDGVDIDNSRNVGLRAYAKQVKEYINKNIKEIDKAVGNQGIHHFYSFTSTQFSLPTEKTYNKLIELYELNKMEGFRTLEDLKNEWGEPTYNPQKTKGKPYKTTGKDENMKIYNNGKKMKRTDIDNKGDRHPTSILQIPEAPEDQEERKHEMMYIFSDTNSDDLDNSRNLGLREYFKNVMEYIGKTLKQITNKVGRSAEHCFYINSTQFALPTDKTYNKLIEVYELDKMEGFRTLEDLKNEWEKIPEPTYNPQKTEGKPYKTNGREDVGVYSEKGYKGEPIDNKGDRHPTSILQIPEAPEDQEERKHEMVYIFSDDGVDIDNSRNLGLRAYAKQVKEYINKNIKEIDKAVGNQGIHHFYSFTSTQFSLPTEKTYNKLIELYELNKMEGFRTLEDLKNEWGEPTYNPQKTKGKPYTDKRTNKNKKFVYGSNIKRVPQDNKGDRHPTSILQIPEAPEDQEERKHQMMYVFKEEQGTYNAQKVEGKPYKTTKKDENMKIYNNGKKMKRTDIDNKGDRHPTTIVKFNNPKKSLHRTQKPVALCEWLIKSYSNEGDLVLDFTAGSGTTGVACKNTNRKFIGIERDEEIFKIMYERLMD